MTPERYNTLRFYLRVLAQRTKGNPMTDQHEYEIGDKVRVPSGDTGRVAVDDDDQVGVVVKTGQLWELKWYPPNLLKKVK